MKNQPQQIHSKSYIIRDLEKAFHTVQLALESLSESAYQEKNGDRWSPAEQVEHLILSTIPIAGALGKDRDWFDQFAAPDHPEKSYAELQLYYEEVLLTGIKAPARFTPREHQTYDKVQQLASWKRLKVGVNRKLDAWSEELLDQCTLPHPALGTLTMRQMLLFTIIHTYHHLPWIKRETRKSA